MPNSFLVVPHDVDDEGQELPGPLLGQGREVTGRRKDGSTFPAELKLSEMRLGERHLFTGLVRDITERKNIERLKSEFVSTVSHELRTPLTSIRGSLGLMAGGMAGELSGKATGLIDIAVRNCERLTLLINDILDIEKIESGRMQFDFAPQPLLPLIQQAIEANRGYGESLGVRFVLATVLADVRVNVDGERLIQVMTNLLSNAAKFSPPDSHVEIMVTRPHGMVRVSVVDHGPGVPMEFRERIFQRFAQADASDTRRRGGTGLGLSITKAIVERFGGQIGFDSVVGQGAVFHFDLPEWYGEEAEPEIPAGRRNRWAP
jgi:signal transduction histidine kinase